MSELAHILEVLRSPSTSATVAQRLGWPERLIDGLLKQLEARGLIIQAEPGLGACSTGCGLCSMQNLCPKSEDSAEQEQVPVSSNPPVWRLTALGLRSVGKREQPTIKTRSAG